MNVLNRWERLADWLENHTAQGGMVGPLALIAFVLTWLMAGSFLAAVGAFVLFALPIGLGIGVVVVLAIVLLRAGGWISRLTSRFRA